MKVSVFLFGIGMALVLAQATILHMLTWDPTVPDLTIILCVYWALYRPTVGAVWGIFVLGCAIDILSSPILGVNAFALSLVFLLTSVGARFIWGRGHLISATVVFVATWVHVGAMALVSPLFQGLESSWAAAVNSVVWEAFFSALIAPAFFVVLRFAQNRLEPARATAPFLHATT